MVAKKKTEESIDIMEMTQGRLTVRLLGKTPLVLNAMSKKIIEGLLLPSKKNAAERAATLKHNPPEEYRSSVYRSMTNDAPTRIVFPSVAFKAALADAAKDIPGAAKAQIGRLTYVEGDTVSIYGIPQISMMVTRMADMNRTPDVRTRAIVPEWACEFSLTYLTPILKEITVVRLLAAAGLMRGVGDGRPEKGKFSYGQFELVGKDDKRWDAIVKKGGRDAQDKALADPQPYNSDTLALLKWWASESERRGFKIA
jgi:hypothetical protein